LALYRENGGQGDLDALIELEKIIETAGPDEVAVS
jgi:hypothetical protein